MLDLFQVPNGVVKKEKSIKELRESYLRPVVAGNIVGALYHKL